MPIRWMFCFACTALLFAACRTSGLTAQQETIRQLQRGKIKEDTSYLYQLPYLPGKKHWIAQGYYGPFSHKHRAALDFKMRKGTVIVAARSGVVVRLKEDSNRGGWSRKNRPHGNHIVIQHSDGSRAGYWHVQYNSILPNLGDTVLAGQPIARSGKTGYALFAHLHFLVWNYDNGTWQAIGTRFRHHKGIGYLRPGKFYKAPRP
jgi:murein DD-endopeptidase MepM/ murein hydrolase activator NlpD